MYGQYWVSFLFGLKCNLQHPCCSVILESDYPEHQNLVTIKNKMSITKKLKISLVPSLRLMHFYLQIPWFLPGRALTKGVTGGCDIICNIISSSPRCSACLGCLGGAAAWDKEWWKSTDRHVPSYLKCINFVSEVCEKSLKSACHF